MADIIAAEFIPWKKIENTQIQNAIGMTGIVAAEFIPWKKIVKTQP
ncbi:hypothetical protein [Dyadobacter sp. 3J3]|nr:hypothetical protein [Dyadobacter sp. 3J3]